MLPKIVTVDVPFAVTEIVRFNVISPKFSPEFPILNIPVPRFILMLPSNRKPFPRIVIVRPVVEFTVNEVTDLSVVSVKLFVAVTPLPAPVALNEIDAFPLGTVPPAQLEDTLQLPEEVEVHVCAQACPVHEKAKARAKARKHGFTKPKNTPRRVANPLLKARGLLF
jgi:hypothetical protein